MNQRLLNKMAKVSTKRSTLSTVKPRRVNLKLVDEIKDLLLETYASLDMAGYLADEGIDEYIKRINDVKQEVRKSYLDDLQLSNVSDPYTVFKPLTDKIEVLKRSAKELGFEDQLQTMDILVDAENQVKEYESYFKKLGDKEAKLEEALGGF